MRGPLTPRPYRTGTFGRVPLSLRREDVLFFSTLYTRHMKLISHGAAREVTGSCHELQIGDKRILLDCGLFQGRRKLAVEKNSSFAFDPPKDIQFP